MLIWQRITCKVVVSIKGTVLAIAGVVSMVSGSSQSFWSSIASQSAFIALIKSRLYWLYLCTSLYPIDTHLIPLPCSLDTLHTVSFNSFLSSLGWILNLEFCLRKLLTFYQKVLWSIRSRLNSSTFWVFRPVFRYVWSKLKLCAQRNEVFDPTYSNTDSKTQNVEGLSLDLIFHNNFW